MRTTLSINENLLKTAKQQAKHDGVTLDALVERALQEFLVKDEVSAEEVMLPTVSGGELMPGLTGTSMSEFYDVLDEHEGIR